MWCGVLSGLQQVFLIETLNVDCVSLYFSMLFEFFFFIIDVGRKFQMASSDGGKVNNTYIRWH